MGTKEEKRKKIEEDTLKIAKYMIATKTSERKTAQVFKISKGGLHHRLTVILKEINKEYYDKVREIVKSNYRQGKGGSYVHQNRMKAVTYQKIDDYIYKTLIANKDKEWVTIKTHEISANAEVAVNCVTRHIHIMLKDSFCRYERRKVEYGSAFHYEYKLKIDKELL